MCSLLTVGLNLHQVNIIIIIIIIIEVMLCLLGLIWPQLWVVSKELVRN